jgi:hypothetical protein
MSMPPQRPTSSQAHDRPYQPTMLKSCLAAHPPRSGGINARLNVRDRATVSSHLLSELLATIVSAEGHVICLGD